MLPDSKQPGLGLAGGQLECVAGAPPSSKPPRRNAWGDPDDPQRVVEEDDVDGEPHECGVHRGARTEEEPLAARKLPPALKSQQPRREPVGDRAALADDATVLAKQRLHVSSHTSWTITHRLPGAAPGRSSAFYAPV